MTYREWLNGHIGTDLVNEEIENNRGEYIGYDGHEPEPGDMDAAMAASITRMWQSEPDQFGHRIEAVEVTPDRNIGTFIRAEYESGGGSCYYDYTDMCDAHPDETFEEMTL